MPENVSIYSLPLELTEVPAANDLLMLVDIDEVTLEKTKKIKFGNLIAGLQEASTVLSALATDLPAINGLVSWDGGLQEASQIIAGNGISIGGGSISLNKFGLEGLANPAENSVILIDTVGASTFLSAGEGITLGGGVVKINLSAGSGISITGITTKTINLDKLGLQNLIDPNSDKIMFWDDSAGKLEWLTIGSDAGLQISGTSLIHSPEPVVVSIRALADGVPVENAQDITYWTIPDELDGATLLTVNAAFLSATGSVDVQLQRNNTNLLTEARITSNWSSYVSGNAGTGSVILNAGDRIEITTNGLVGTPEGLDVYLGLTV